MTAHLPRRVRVATTASFLFALLIACDDGPTRPSPPATPPPTPPGAPVTILSLVITGPNEIAPGATAQFTATALMSDGSPRNVTNEATWRSGNESVLGISPTGVATGRDRGESTIQVSLGGRTATKGDVLVLPVGTYRLRGIVGESGSARTLYRARVEVTAGIGQGLAVTANGGGYSLHGVAGDVDLRITADGYQELRTRVQVTKHDDLSFNLVPTGPRANVTGAYTLTVAVAPECRAALPPEAATRSFHAVVDSSGSDNLTVRLENARFLIASSRTFNRFGGFSNPNGASFYLTGPDNFYYASYGSDVLEQLTDTTLYTMSGYAVMTVSPNGLTGTLAGLIEVVQGTTPGRLQRVASCRSSDHQFVLGR
jgi:hypothetical protein